MKRNLASSLLGAQPAAPVKRKRSEAGEEATKASPRAPAPDPAPWTLDVDAETVGRYRKQVEELRKDKQKGRFGEDEVRAAVHLSLGSTF